MKNHHDLAHRLNLGVADADGEAGAVLKKVESDMHLAVLRACWGWCYIGRWVSGHSSVIVT